MNAEEARRKAFKIVEQQKKVYDEFAEAQLQRLTKLINESAEAGDFSVPLFYESIQPEVKKWLVDNGYKVEDKSTEDDYFFVISW